MMRSLNSRHPQAGLSLIELMIALTLASFLILGVTQIFIDNKRSYVFQQNQAGNQENSRYALGFLEQELAKAGYRRQPNIDPAYALPADDSSLSGCNFAAGISIVANSEQDICIRYQARDPAEVDCQGKALTETEKDAIQNPTALSATPDPATPVFVERFTVAQSADKKSSSLYCTSSRGTKAQEVTPNVVAIRFEFGTGPISDRTVTTYTTSPSLPIRAVRYAVLMQSPGNGVRENADNPVLSQWQSLYGTGDKITDSKQIYQIAEGTVTLRNLMP